MNGPRAASDAVRVFCGVLFWTGQESPDSTCPRVPSDVSDEESCVRDWGPVSGGLGPLTRRTSRTTKVFPGMGSLRPHDQPGDLRTRRRAGDDGVVTLTHTGWDTGPLSPLQDGVLRDSGRRRVPRTGRVVGLLVTRQPHRAEWGPTQHGSVPGTLPPGLRASGPRTPRPPRDSPDKTGVVQGRDCP